MILFLSLKAWPFNHYKPYADFFSIDLFRLKVNDILATYLFFTSTLNTASIILILRSSILHNEHSFVVDIMLALKLNKAKCKNKH